ncbi:hypothetical protein BGW39_004241 [Mortierella sp. 14UC]|nr:hypothetical protein BGW39_004241 [Mortierella sp. 14UC]
MKIAALLSVLLTVFLAETTASAIVTRYNNAVYGNRTNSSIRISAVGPLGEATNSTEDILPFCVTITRYPIRTRIFKNQQTCTVEKWRTLFIFTAHTKKDRHHAPYPVCVGLATFDNPQHSVIFETTTSCTIEGRNTDFSFYMSGSYREPSANTNH